jgi:hypothetical protein
MSATIVDSPGHSVRTAARQVRAVIIAVWRRGGMLPAATVEQMVPAQVAVSER